MTTWRTVTGPTKIIASVLAVLISLVSAVPAHGAGGDTGLITPFDVPGTSGQELTQITSGPDGNLWFTLSAANAVVKMTPDGTQTIYTNGITPNSQPKSLTTGPDGNVWFAEANSYDASSSLYRIGRITTDGVVTEFPTPVQPPSGSQGIVSGPDNSIWYTAALGGSIAKVSMDGTVTVFPLGMSFLTLLFAITTGPDGNVWFAGMTSSSGRIGKLTPTGTVTLYSGDGIGAGGLVAGLTPGPNGNLWFTLPSTNQVGQITTDGQATLYSTGITADAAPVGIVTGADGNLWFSEAGSGSTPSVRSAVARMTTDGVVSEFPVGPYATNDLSGIIAGSDGNLWTVAILEPNIYRVGTGQAEPSSDPTVIANGPTIAAVSGFVYPGAATSQVTLRCSTDSTFNSIVYSGPAQTGNPATGTAASPVSGSCDGLAGNTNYFSQFVSVNTFPGSLASTVSYTTITPFTTPSRQHQTLRRQAVPKSIKSAGTTVVNWRSATTRQGLPLTARVIATQRRSTTRGDVTCLRTRYGVQRKVTVRTSGACQLRIRVVYKAAGSANYYPLKKTFTFKTQRVR